jgi:hypothetical protein
VVSRSWIDLVYRENEVDQILFRTPTEIDAWLPIQKPLLSAGSIVLRWRRRDRCPTIRGISRWIGSTAPHYPVAGPSWLTKRIVVQTGDPDRLDFAAALRRGTRG